MRDKQTSRRTRTLGAILGCWMLPLLCTAAPIPTGTVAPAIDPDPTLMTTDEAARHRERLAALSGAEREAYRNQVYSDLRQRAQAKGYHLPEVPPWGRTDLLAAPTTAEQAPEPAATREPPSKPAAQVGDIMGSIARHRAEIAARRAEQDAEQQALRERVDAHIEAQRKTMRERFEQEMARPELPAAPSRRNDHGYRPAPAYGPPVYVYPPYRPAPYPPVGYGPRGPWGWAPPY